jgi:N-acetylglucosaminyldiphosphoundecaprenol N-acetyl-beta-D-mannosaminyltransferase
MREPHKTLIPSSVKSDNKDYVIVLDVPLYSGDIASACQMLTALCQSGNRSNNCVSATGAHGLIIAKREKQFSDILKSFFLNLPDGMPGVWIGRIKGAKSMKRCYGPDFFEALLRYTADKEINHFFCGGNDGVAEQLKVEVSKKFNNNNVVGTFCPPFLAIDQYRYENIANHINKTSADIIWIGLSTPKQEMFAFQLAKFTRTCLIICVGAAFDFHTARIKQAPRWIQSIGMEWFFRLCVEPTRLFKRYSVTVPLFIFYNLIEILTFAKKKDHDEK